MSKNEGKSTIEINSNEIISGRSKGKFISHRDRGVDEELKLLRSKVAAFEAEMTDRNEILRSKIEVEQKFDDAATVISNLLELIEENKKRMVITEYDNHFIELGRGYLNE